MINIIILYGTKKQLLEVELPDTQNYNDHQWMTNCFGVDFVAYCTDSNITFDEYKMFSEKFKRTGFGFAHYDYYNEIIKVSKGWIGSITSDPRNPEKGGLLGNIGVQIVQTDSKFIHDISIKYASLRSVPFDYHRPEENIYIVDLNKATLKDLPTISSTSSKMLNNLKSNPKSGVAAYGIPVSTLIFHNNDYSIIIGQMAALQYLLSAQNMKDVLANYHIMNTTIKKTPRVYYEIAANHLGLTLNNLGN